MHTVEPIVADLETTDPTTWLQQIRERRAQNARHRFEEADHAAQSASLKHALKALAACRRIIENCQAPQFTTIPFVVLTE